MTMCSHAPIKIKITFCITDGKQTAEASYDCPPGELPDEIELADAAASILANVQEQLGPQWRWQTREEFVQDVLDARSGGLGIKFAVPGPDEFEAEWAQ